LWNNQESKGTSCTHREVESNMALAHLTRNHIIASFRMLAEERPFHRITVLDIIKQAEINKNTFYYHFEDRCDLVRAVFRTDFGQSLKGSFLTDTLIYSDCSDKYSEYPFYINARSVEENLQLNSFFWIAR
jgi:AcrR family transcriptional regulator